MRSTTSLATTAGRDNGTAVDAVEGGGWSGGGGGSGGGSGGGTLSGARASRWLPGQFTSSVMSGTSLAIGLSPRGAQVPPL